MLGWITDCADPVKVWADTVPAGVIVCWCVPRAEPVKTGADTVPAGVPADLASDMATAELVVLLVGAALIDSDARLVPEPNTDWGIMDRAPVAPDAE